MVLPYCYRELVSGQLPFTIAKTVGRVCEVEGNEKKDRHRPSTELMALGHHTSGRPFNQSMSSLHKLNRDLFQSFRSSSSNVDDKDDAYQEESIACRDDIATSVQTEPWFKVSTGEK